MKHKKPQINCSVEQSVYDLFLTTSKAWNVAMSHIVLAIVLSAITHPSFDIQTYKQDAERIAGKNNVDPSDKQKVEQFLQEVDFLRKKYGI